jgi:Polysaccharide lyase
MARPIFMTILLGAVLAACGQVITITMPGGPAPSAAAVGGGTAVVRGIGRLEPVPEGYERLFTNTSYGFRPSGPGEPVRRGLKSERFELRLGDCDGSDCASNRARTEIREVVSEAKAALNQDIWYGYSFLNVNVGSVIKATTPGAVFGQWKMDGDLPPVFRITQQAAGEGNFAACDPSVCSPMGVTSDDVVVELEDMHVARQWGAAQNNGAVCRLFNMQAAQGKWMDIVVNTNFATDTNGYLRVWVNGELRCNYFGGLVSPQRFFTSANIPTHRRGIFAASTKRWAAQQTGANVLSMTVYYDEFLVGKTRADVDTRLREASSAAAKD